MSSACYFHYGRALKRLCGGISCAQGTHGIIGVLYVATGIFALGVLMLLINSLLALIVNIYASSFTLLVFS